MDADELNEMIHARGLTSAQTARILGCSRALVSLMRAGRRRITEVRADSIRLRLHNYDAETNL